MEVDYSKLIGRIVEKYGTRGAFAEAMGMSHGKLSNRLKGRSDWNINEYIKACDLLDIPAQEMGSYFFTLKLR